MTRLRRLWAVPLGVHAAALALVLGALLPAMAPRSAFTSDEGAYALQVASLREGSWAYRYRAGRFDPEGDHFPIVNSDRQGARHYAYVKHPAWPLLLLGATRAAGVSIGLHLLPLLGAVGTAVAAWLLAGEVVPRLSRAAFWAAAASPVAVNGYLLWAHTTSAAVAGAALVLAARIVRKGPSPWSTAGLAAALVAGVLLRSEGLLLAGAVALAVAGAGLRGSHPLARRAARAGATFALLAGAALVAALAERAWVRALIGGTGYENLEARGGVVSPLARLAGAWHVLGQAHYTRPPAALPVVVGAGLVVGVGWLALRRARPHARRDLAVAVAVAVALSVLRFLVAPEEAIPGLFAAWPLALLGLLLFPWRRAAPAAVVLGAVLALFGVAVLATQYPEGGGLEWGGRFLSPAVAPLAVVTVAGLVSGLGRLDPVDRRATTALLAGLAALTAVLALATVGVARSRQGAAVEAVARHPSEVMVTTVPALPRIAWSQDARLSWMLATHDTLDPLLIRLRAAGVPQVTLVTERVAVPAPGSYTSVREVRERALARSGLRLVLLTG